MGTKSKAEDALSYEVSAALRLLGERIRIARQRRELTIKMLAEKAFISVPTLRQIEKGHPNVSIGKYLSVLSVMGLDFDVSSLADPELDTVGKTLTRTRKRVRSKVLPTVMDDDF